MQLDVFFANGREVLNAYWGYLTGGGLSIARHAHAQDLPEGQPVTLHIHIGSRHAFSVQGKVARAVSDKIIIAFDTEEAQYQLLTAALSERAIDVEARLSVASMAHAIETKARLFELSEDGCCLRLSPETAPSVTVGTEVAIEAGDIRIAGCVVSANEHDRCVLFGMNDSAAIEAVRACLVSA